MGGEGGLPPSFAQQALLQEAPTPKISQNRSVFDDFALVGTATKNEKIDGFFIFFYLWTRPRPTKSGARHNPVLPCAREGGTIL